MFSLPVRIAFILMAATYGIYKLAGGHQSGYLFLAASGLLAFGYFRYGPIRPAFLAMRRGDLTAARKHVQTIKFPKLLSAESRAYLHWVNGVIAAEISGDFPHAEEQMRSAINGRLRTSNDRCIATAELARIVAKGNDVKKALQLLEQAEKIPHRNGARAYLDKLRAEFEQVG
jgi:hypothetical protein